jgi:hypothetical protein
MFFNDDGTIRKVIPTLRGVGVTSSHDKIQIDRYSAKSERGSSIAFLDDKKRSEGWQAVLNKENAWFRYDRVDFGGKAPGLVVVNAAAKAGGVVEIRLSQTDGPLIARVDLPPNGDWHFVKARLLEIPAGIQDIFLVSKNAKPVAVDWVRFE